MMGRSQVKGKRSKATRSQSTPALVTVPVTVMDRGGKYVPNLTRRDFHVFENGVEQRIAYFATVDVPFTVVLLIDTSGSTQFKIEDMHSAAISFVNQLKEQDRVMVMSFDDSIRTLCEPTSDRDTLIQAIRRTRNGGGTRLYDAVHQVNPAKVEIDHWTQSGGPVHRRRGHHQRAGDL
jgi:Ca-activated chloride channel family protein